MTNRTSMTLKNIFASYLSVIPSTLLNLVTRFVFVRYISFEYLGASGLFSSIFAMLSFADLGIGEAITYKLYKPLAENNKKEIGKLMKFYQKFYYFLIVFVIIFGLCCIPFLPQLTNNSSLPNLTLIYVLFLLNTVLSYFCADKKSFLIANQESYINSALQNLFLCLQYIIQLIVIVTTSNFILYLIIQILAQLMCGLSINWFVKVKRNDIYNIKEQEKFDKDDLKELVGNSGSLVFHKIGNLLLDNFTNILISAELGLLVMGHYSNYLIIINMCIVLLSYLTFPTQAAIGNLCASNKDNDYNELVLQRLEFIIYAIYSFVAVQLFANFDLVIEIYANDTYFSKTIIYLLATTFLVNGLKIIPNQFKTVNGLFKNDCFRPLIEAVIFYIIGSVALKYYGIEGLLITSLLIRIFSACFIERSIVYRNVFKKSPFFSFLIFLSRIIFVFLTGLALSTLLTNVYITNNIITLIVKCMICAVVYSSFFMIIYWKNKNFIYCRNLIVNRLKSKFKT